MIIDFHTHAFPDKMAERSIHILEDRSGLQPFGNGMVSVMTQKMDEAGVSRAVVANIATNAKQTHNVNSFAISLLDNPRMIPFGSVHPDSDWKTELNRLRDAGILGIKLHPDYQDFYIDEERLLPIYEEILRLGFVLLFHTGLDLGLPDPVHADPARTERVLSILEGEKVVFAHMGGFQRWEEASSRLLGKDVYLDTSCSARFLPPEKFAAMVQSHGPDKVLYGSDFPWNPMGEEVEAVRSLPVTEEQKEKILGGNAARLLGI